MSINACNINVSIMLSSLLANTRILSCFFFFFLITFNNLSVIPVIREKIEVRLALANPTGAPTILVKEQIDTPPVAALKTIKIFSM